MWPHYYQPYIVEVALVTCPAYTVITHYGLRIRYSDGSIAFVESSRTGGRVRMVDAWAFAEGGPITVLHRTAHPNAIRRIVRRVEPRMGEPYELFGNNCERFARWAYFGDGHAVSDQAAFGGALAAGATLLALGAGGPVTLTAAAVAAFLLR